MICPPSIGATTPTTPPLPSPSCHSRRPQLFFSLMSTLVECVPNFSEGRDKSKVDAIVDAMKIPGVYLLDRESDTDHNRSVITLVGEREAIQEAAIRGVGKASEMIDLNVHQGATPRLCPGARIWRTFAAVNSKAFATTSPPTRRGVRTSATRACIPPPVQRSSARASF